METLAPADLSYAVSTLHVLAVVLAVVVAMCAVLVAWVGSLLLKLLVAARRIEALLESVLAHQLAGGAMDHRSDEDAEIARALATSNALTRALRGSGSGSTN